MPHFITTHSINNPNYIKMQQNKNQQLDAKFRKFIKVLIMNIDREDFVKTKLTEGYLKFVGKYMHRWLQDNPQEDENGKPMEMGAASQG